MTGGDAWHIGDPLPLEGPSKGGGDFSEPRVRVNRAGTRSRNADKELATSLESVAGERDAPTRPSADHGRAAAHVA